MTSKSRSNSSQMLSFVPATEACDVLGLGSADVEVLAMAVSVGFVRGMVWHMRRFKLSLAVLNASGVRKPLPLNLGSNIVLSA